MIRHIVLFKLAAESEAQRVEQAAFIAGQLESLIPLIPDISSLEMVLDVRQTPANAEVALVSEFEDHAALDRYQVHPDHVRVSSSIRPILAARSAIDFEV